MRSDATKTHSTPLVGIKPNEISMLVAGARFELATFRLYDPIANSVGYKHPPWLGCYQSAYFSTIQMKKY
jgi:hypothetical protein